MDRGLGHDAGVTLIELMITVAVIATLATTVTLSVSRPGGDNRADWSTFMALHDRMRAEATFAQELRAVSIDEAGYQTLRWSDGWRPLGTRQAWHGQVVVLEPFRNDAPLEFAPGGQVTRFQLRFGDGDGARLCQSDGWGPITCRTG